ncbi:MAG: hypothetical protein ACI8SJ_000018 [Shewanella sp.]|jgi:hypothetical protein
MVSSIVVDWSTGNKSERGVYQKPSADNTNRIKYLFIQWEFKALKASGELEANSYSISSVHNAAYSALPFALKPSRRRNYQAFHFCFALIYKGCHYFVNAL